MLTIIFGAGASYDSDPGNPSVNSGNTAPNPYRPPLARDLFHQRFGVQAQQNPAVQALIPRLQRASNVEEELEGIASRMSNYPPVYRQLLSMRYYLRSVIENAQNYWRNSYIFDVSTYLELLDTIDRWRVRTNERVSLITFNYDTLLDLACTAVLNLNLSKMDAYVNNNSAFQVFKVHGSIDWFHKVLGTQGNTMAHADTLEWTREFFTSQEGRAGDGNTDYVPAIAIPTVSKTTFEFPDAHRKKLVATIRETDHLLIIGWRGAEQHFLKLWRDAAASRDIKKIHVVGSNVQSTEAVYHEKLKVEGIVSSTTHFSYDGFANFVAKELHNFLQ